MTPITKARAQEVLVMLAIGDGIIAAGWPFQHTLLWRSGPQPWRRLMDEFVERPRLTRALGLAEVAFGVWLVSRLLSPAHSRPQTSTLGGRRARPGTLMAVDRS